MTLSLQITGTGFDEVQKLLSPAKFKQGQRAGMRGALLQAETEMKDSATRELYQHPEGFRKRTGLLRASYSRGHKGNVYQLGEDQAKIGSNIFYAKMMEEGTKPHIIRAKNGRALAFTPTVGYSLTGAHSKVGGGTVGGRALFRGKSGKAIAGRKGAQQVIVTSVHHPGTKPYRIVEMAVRHGGTRIVNAYAKALAKSWGVG